MPDGQVIPHRIDIGVHFLGCSAVTGRTGTEVLQNSDILNKKTPLLDVEDLDGLDPPGSVAGDDTDPDSTRDYHQEALIS